MVITLACSSCRDLPQVNQSNQKPPPAARVIAAPIESEISSSSRDPGDGIEVHTLVLACMGRSSAANSGVPLFRLHFARQAREPVKAKLEFERHSAGCSEVDAMEVSVDGMPSNTYIAKRGRTENTCDFDIESGNLVWLSLIGGAQMDVRLLSRTATKGSCSINIETVDAISLSYPTIE